MIQTITRLKSAGWGRAPPILPAMYMHRTRLKTALTRPPSNERGTPISDRNQQSISPEGLCALSPVGPVIFVFARIMSWTLLVASPEKVYVKYGSSPKLVGDF
jgi:hypothetical protein